MGCGNGEVVWWVGRPGEGEAAVPARRRPPAHLSGMLRMRWLNSFLAWILLDLALGWWAARRMSWSQKEFISAAVGACV